MSAPNEHPSYLALDRLARGAGDPAVLSHVAGCERCAGHLGALSTPPELPDWVLALEDSRPAAREAEGRARETEVRARDPWTRIREAIRPRRRPWAWGVAASAAVAVLALGLLRPDGPPADGTVAGGSPATGPQSDAPLPATTAKGLPSVSVYVKRGERVFLWSGEEGVLAGDRLRLSVTAAGFGRVTVATPDEEGGWAVLFEDALPERGTLMLPSSFRVDGEPGSERLLVVWSRAPVAAGELARLAEERPRTDERWTSEVVLEKGPAR